MVANRAGELVDFAGLSLGGLAWPAEGGCLPPPLLKHCLPWEAFQVDWKQDGRACWKSCIGKIQIIPKLCFSH